VYFFFFFSSRRRHTRWPRDWSSDVCSSDLFASVASGETFFPPYRKTLSPLATDAKDGAALPWSKPSIAPQALRKELPECERNLRSEERRVGKEDRSRRAPYHIKKQEDSRVS